MRILIIVEPARLISHSCHGQGTGVTTLVSSYLVYLPAITHSLNEQSRYSRHLQLDFRILSPWFGLDFGFTSVMRINTAKQIVSTPDSHSWTNIPNSLDLRALNCSVCKNVLYLFRLSLFSFYFKVHGAWDFSHIPFSSTLCPIAEPFVIFIKPFNQFQWLYL